MAALPSHRRPAAFHELPCPPSSSLVVLRVRGSAEANAHCCPLLVAMRIAVLSFQHGE